MPAHSDSVYLDYAATAPLDERLIEVLLKASWANPSSLHSYGREARLQLECARRDFSAAVGARRPSEIIFTSGATESLNMAVTGLIKPDSNYVVVSAIEHPAVLKAANALKAKGIRVREVKPNTQGIVTPEALKAVLDDLLDEGAHVAFAAVQAVNNELGTIQPVHELAEVAHSYRTLFICDMVQALGKIDIKLEESGVDVAAFSGHKIAAPKGIGALYIRTQVNITPLMRGGGQEIGLRPGTTNVASAVAFARALDLAMKERKHTWDHLCFLRQLMLAKLELLTLEHPLRPVLNSQDSCVPHIVSLRCDGLEGETLVLRFDEKGIALSSGSACSSASLEPSHVLRAIGLRKEDAQNTIRLSFGRNTTAKDIDAFLNALPEVLK